MTVDDHHPLSDMTSSMGPAAGLDSTSSMDVVKQVPAGLRGRGDMIGRYEVMRVLGIGGMGVVYEAKHPALDNRLAIKTLRPEMSSRTNLVDRFRAEALAASRFRDERLPQIYDIDKLPDDTWFIAMELLEGEDLDSFLSRETLTPRVAVRLVVEILQVLEKVHRHGIIHRDIKPANIFLARSDLLGVVPKLLDFGLAHVAHSDIEDAAKHPSPVAGTPSYMAKEHWSGGVLGPWSDLFSMGVVLFECIAGRHQRPWNADSFEAYRYAVISGTPPRRLESMVASFERGLDEVIRWVLEPEISERCHDAAALIRALEPWCAPRSALARLASPSPSASFGSTVDRIPLSQLTPAVSKHGHESARSRVGADRLTNLRSQLARLGAGSPASVSVGATTPTMRAGERRLSTFVVVEARFRASEAPLSGEDFEGLSAQILDLLARELDLPDVDLLPQPGGILVAVFGYQRIDEHDPERAIVAALAILERARQTNIVLADIGYTMSLHIGIHSGFVAKHGESRTIDAISGSLADQTRRLVAQVPANKVCITEPALARVAHLFQTREIGLFELGSGNAGVIAHEVRDSVAHLRWGAARTSPFVGRVEELESLRTALDAHMSKPDRTTAVLLTGQAGVGKSRLLTQFLGQLTRTPTHRTQIVRVQPRSGGPLGLWVEVLRSIIHEGEAEPSSVSDHERFEQFVGSLDAGLRRQLEVQQPVVELLLGQSDSAIVDDSIQGIGDRLEAVLALCIAAGSARAAARHDGRPLILVLENLHRADPASLDLLRRVFGHPVFADVVPPLVFLTTRQSGDIDLSATCRIVPVAIPPFSKPDSGDLAAALCDGEQLASQVRSFVMSRSGGNPLFIEELIEGLRDADLLHADKEQLQRFPAPASLYGLLLARFDRLPPELREATRLAAVLGVEFEAEIYSAVARTAWAESELPHARPDESHLEELERRGILCRQVPEQPRRWAFTRSLFQSAVYGTVLSDNRRLAHAFAAEAIERVHADEIERYVQVLLEHYSHTDNFQRTAECARRVGWLALRLGAYPDTIGALTLALELEGRLHEDSVLPAARSRCDLAMAYARAGHFADCIKQGQALVELLEPLTSTRSDEALRLCGTVRMAMAEASFHRGELTDSREYARAAEGDYIAGERPIEAAEAQCWQGFTLRAQGRVGEGLELARKGWEVLRDSGNDALIARAGHDLGNILHSTGAHAEALIVFEPAIAAGDALRLLGRKHDAMWGSVAARSGRAMARAAMGDLDGAISDQRMSWEQALADDNFPAQAYSSFHLAIHLLERGDLDEAAEVATQSLTTCERLGMAERSVRCRRTLARIYMSRNQPDKAQIELQRAQQVARGLSTDVWLAVVDQLIPLLLERELIGVAAQLVAELRGHTFDDAHGEHAQALITRITGSLNATQATAVDLDQS